MKKKSIHRSIFLFNKMLMQFLNANKRIYKTQSNSDLSKAKNHDIEREILYF